MKKTKILSVMAILFLGIAIWYLFIKEYDYQITLRANVAPGGLYYQIKDLNYWGDKEENKSITLLDTVLFKTVKQKIAKQDSSFILDWNFKSINDTITKITVGLISEEHSISNRLQVLVGSSNLVESVKEEMILFRNKLSDFTDTFRVVLNGEDYLPEMEYVYISLNSKRYEKASQMIRFNDELYPKMVESNIKKQGYPFVKISNWNMQTDSIYFDYGFPIQHQDSLSEIKNLDYDKTKPKKALKATYYGNYRNSDQAWFCLMEYAESHNIQIDRTPLEIFYNNPMQGGGELEWKAEIFLPIIDNTK